MSLWPSSERVPPFTGAVLFAPVRTPALASPTAPKTRQRVTTTRIRGLVTRCIFRSFRSLAGPCLAVHESRRALGALDRDCDSLACLTSLSRKEISLDQ